MKRDRWHMASASIRLDGEQPRAQRAERIARRSRGGNAVACVPDRGVEIANGEMREPRRVRDRGAEAGVRGVIRAAMEIRENAHCRPDVAQARHHPWGPDRK